MYLSFQLIKRTACERESNLVSFHHEGAVYYRTCKVSAVRCVFPVFVGVESLTPLFAFQEVKCDEELMLLVESSVSLLIRFGLHSF